jgi:hypothetical protein
LPQLSSGPLARKNGMVYKTANAKQCLAFGKKIMQQKFIGVFEGVVLSKNEPLLQVQSQ